MAVLEVQIVWWSLRGSTGGTNSMVVTRRTMNHTKIAVGIYEGTIK